eukprot:COSAG02_NODE_809_length_16922_cov_11.295013_12_plen_165_part_00
MRRLRCHLPLFLVTAGDLSGQLPAYVIGNSGTVALRHNFTVDTVPHTNQTLLAVCDLWDKGFDLELRHAGPSGLRHCQDNTFIPVYYDKVDRGWYGARSTRTRLQSSAPTVVLQARRVSAETTCTTTGMGFWHRAILEFCSKLPLPCDSAPQPAGIVGRGQHRG